MFPSGFMGPGGRTQFTWKEKLVYPIWLGGPVGALVSKPVLAWVWRRNLRNLQQRFAPAP